MNARLANYLRWIVVISFLVVPPLLVRNFVSAAPAIRVVTYFVLIVVLTSFGLYLALRRGDIVAEMPISKELKTEKSRKITATFFRGLAGLMVIAGMFLFVSIAPSIVSYALGQAPAVTEVRTITQINSPAMPGALYIYESLLTDENKYLSFPYPDQVLQVGHKYTFKLLPNSDFVLSAQSSD